MAALGMIIVLVGCLVAIVGGIMVLIEAFKENIWWGLAYVFVPFASLVFLFAHWDVSKRGFLISLGGAAVVVIGMIMGVPGLESMDQAGI